jgi:HEAT repeats
MGGIPSSEFAHGALGKIAEAPPPFTCKASVDTVEWNQWIRETTESVRTSQFPGVRAMAAQNLVYETFWLGRKDIDDKSVAEIVSLLDVPDEPVRNGVTRSLGQIGPRARAAVPKLKELLPEVDCHQVSGASADIRFALRQMGVKPPPAKCGGSRG